MKRIEFIAPVESMRGNLSGSQELNYRENNNPAYEAPDGDAHALNYQPRFVGAKRAKDGLKYFSVRTKSTTKLTNKSRTAMAILGSTSAIINAMMVGHAADWRKLQQIFAYRSTHGWDEAGENITFNKWVNYWLRRMLQYKENDVTLTGSGLSVKLENPYVTYDEGPTLAISTAIFSKFVGMLYTGDGVEFTIDGVKFIAADGDQWNTFKRDATNQNITAQWASIDAPDADDAPVKYNSRQVYTSAGVAVKTDDTPIANEKYTTIAPSA